MRDTRDVRATGLQGDASAGDHRDPRRRHRCLRRPRFDTDDHGRRGGPRWVGPVAAAALVVLIGYGVATSASTSSLPRTAPVTSSTVATPTTAPTTTTTIPAPLVPYYAADLPREYSVQAADMQLQSDGGYFAAGDYQLFAAEGASAGSGRWFSISSFPGGGRESIYATDAYRVQTDRDRSRSRTCPSGQSDAQFSPDGSTVSDTHGVRMG